MFGKFWTPTRDTFPLLEQGNTSLSKRKLKLELELKLKLK